MILIYSLAVKELWLKLIIYHLKMMLDTDSRNEHQAVSVERKEFENSNKSLLDPVGRPAAGRVVLCRRRNMTAERAPALPLGLGHQA